MIYFSSFKPFDNGFKCHNYRLTPFFVRVSSCYYAAVLSALVPNCHGILGAAWASGSILSGTATGAKKSRITKCCPKARLRQGVYTAECPCPARVELVANYTRNWNRMRMAITWTKVGQSPTTLLLPSPAIGRRLKYLNRRQTIEQGPDNMKHTDKRTPTALPDGQEAEGQVQHTRQLLTLWELRPRQAAHKHL